MASKRSCPGPDLEDSAAKRGRLQPEWNSQVPGPQWGSETGPITAMPTVHSAPTAELHVSSGDHPGASSFRREHFASGWASSSFESDDMDIMRWSPGAGDERSLEEDTASWSFSQLGSLDTACCDPATEGNSLATSGASCRPTSVDGELEIHSVAPPTMSTGGPSIGPHETAHMASIPLPVLPDEFPACCEGIYREMQKKELRRGGGYFM
ncbi:hypothetical protein V5799_018086 [Amblyomma americanum]|uniref:Uncharacterized protein n=1 Tax=Amblyomma americanum TaxID=6943 RepID=A0AAQ4F1F5_AMBAM